MLQIFSNICKNNANLCNMRSHSKQTELWFTSIIFAEVSLPVHVIYYSAGLHCKHDHLSLNFGKKWCSKVKLYLTDSALHGKQNGSNCSQDNLQIFHICNFFPFARITYICLFNIYYTSFVHTV